MKGGKVEDMEKKIWVSQGGNRWEVEPLGFSGEYSGTKAVGVHDSRRQRKLQNRAGLGIYRASGGIARHIMQH
jgi:hypothetical protein